MKLPTERPFMGLPSRNCSAVGAKDGRWFIRALNKVCVILLFFPGLGEWVVREMVFAGFDGNLHYGQVIKSLACR